MYASFEEKGKIFTDVITKRPVEVLIQTTLHLIRGQVHIRPQDRIKDEINRGEDFLAVTNAHVLDAHGEDELHHCNFMMVNRDQIVWIIPLEEQGETEKGK